MTNKQIALYATISGCLPLSRPTFASSKGPVLIHSELPEQILAEPHAVPGLAMTNVLLRQILAEAIKTNSLKEDKRYSDGEKNYSPGYITSVGNKTLRCDIVKDYPQRTEGDKARQRKHLCLILVCSTKRSGASAGRRYPTPAIGEKRVSPDSSVSEYIQRRKYHTSNF